MNFFNIGPTELLMILVIAVIVFGPNKIPDIGASIGKAIRQFRAASRDLTNGLNLEDLNPSEDAPSETAPANAADPSPASVSSEPAPEPAQWQPEPAAPSVAPEYPPITVAEPAPPILEEAGATVNAPPLPPAPQARRFVVSREAWQKPPEDKSTHVEHS